MEEQRLRVSGAGCYGPLFENMLCSQKFIYVKQIKQYSRKTKLVLMIVRTMYIEQKSAFFFVSEWDINIFIKSIWKS